MKTNSQGVFATGFGDVGFQIAYNNENARSIASFLFTDFPGVKNPAQSIKYDIVSSGNVPMLSLWENDKRLYFGSSQYLLAYILMNEVIYHCINKNDSHHAIHAGAVHKNNRCLILPGTSGKGKSTLTSWLLASGFQYLTDELVFIDNSQRVMPLVRPVNLKVNNKHVSWLLHEDINGEIISDKSGSMIPHRMLNSNFVMKQPVVTDIIFPNFVAGHKAELVEISSARSCLFLLQSLVNARNLEQHGVPDLAHIVKGCRSYKLTYGNFKDLEPIFLFNHAWC